MMDQVKVSTSIPASWADALERLSRHRQGPNSPPSKAGILRGGLRLYLQHALPEEWSELELGPSMPATEPVETIDSTAVEIGPYEYLPFTPQGPVRRRP